MNGPDPDGPDRDELDGLLDELDPASTRDYLEDGYPGSDLGNAGRIVHHSGSDLRWISSWTKWIVWDGSRWGLDSKEGSGSVAKGIEAVTAVREKLAGSRDPVALGKVVKRLETGSGMLAAIRFARSWLSLRISHDELDADPWLLNIENGTIDLRTGELREHDRGDLCTMQAPVKLLEGAECPKWEKAIEEWFPDLETRLYVQRLVGQAVVGTVRDHLFVIHYGTGRNGKGTFSETLSHVLGPYAITPHIGLFVYQRNEPADTEKTVLYRTRLAVAAETEQGIRLRESQIKNLTGGDSIRARRMHEDSWEFEPTHSLWMQTNHLPMISGTDLGIWSRIKVVPWVSTFEGSDRIGDLSEQLREESSGILAWMLEGVAMWQRDGLEEPEAVRRATLDFRTSQDVLAQFAEDEGVVFDSEREVRIDHLTDRLSTWAKNEGLATRDIPNKNGVAKWLRNHGCDSRRIEVEGRLEDGAMLVGKTLRRTVWGGVGFDTSKKISGDGDGPEPERMDLDELEDLEEFTPPDEAPY